MELGALEYKNEAGLIPDPQETEIRGFLLGDVEKFSKECTDNEIEFVEEELVDQYVRCELIPGGVGIDENWSSPPALSQTG